MSQRLLSLCGVIAPLLFGFMAILGGALRPGYSHVAHTVSELMSPGSPNKLLLDILFATYSLLLVLFGVGILRYIRQGERSRQVGMIGAWLYIAAGLITLSTAVAFPQDPWGTPFTFAGWMHIMLTGVAALLSLLSILLIGIWFRRSGVSPGFVTYCFISAGLSVLAAGYFVASSGGPTFGLAERIAALAGFQWMFVLAVWIFGRARLATTTTLG